MASCVDVPTLTTTQVSTSQSLVTTTTESVSTAPGSVSTVVVSTCAQVGTSSSCQPTATTSFITAPGVITTIIVPATLTVNVPVTVVTTLFGSSCSSSSSSISSSVSSTPSTPTPTPTPTPTSFSDLPTSTLTDTPSSTATLIPVVSTPPPTVITSNSLVTSGGSIFLSSFTTTSIQPATTVLAQSTSSSSIKSIAVGPVVGGIVGGLAVLLLLGLLTWRLVKKQSKFNRFLNRNHDDFHHGPHHRGPFLEKPSYQYGMVGQPTSNPVGLDPQHSNPASQNAFGNGSGTGQAQGPPQSTAGQVSGQASGQASGPLGNDGGLGQASGPPGALGTDGGLGQTVAGTSHGVIGNMPPIAHTGDPSLIPVITGKGTAAGASGLLAAATPSSSRPSTGSSSQALGPLVTPVKPQGGYPPAQQSWNTNQVYGQAHSGPSKLPKNKGTTKLSISSLASTSSAYSNVSWNDNSSANHTITAANSGSVPPVLPSMEASSYQQQYQQHHQRTASGSVAPRQVTNNADYEYNPYAEVGSSSMGGASSSQEAPLYDEQGRPLNMPSEKVSLVHLDGALYQDDPRSPPAYAE